MKRVLIVLLILFVLVVPMASAGFFADFVEKFNSVKHNQITGRFTLPRFLGNVQQQTNTQVQGVAQAPVREQGATQVVNPNAVTLAKDFGKALLDSKGDIYISSIMDDDVKAKLITKDPQTNDIIVEILGSDNTIRKYKVMPGQEANGKNFIQLELLEEGPTSFSLDENLIPWCGHCQQTDMALNSRTLDASQVVTKTATQATVQPVAQAAPALAQSASTKSSGGFFSALRKLF